MTDFPAVVSGTIEERAEYAFGLHQRIVSLIRRITEQIFELTDYLKQMRDERLYEYLGYSSFKEYLASPEIGWSLATFNRYHQIVEFWRRYGIPQEELPELGVSKASVLAQYEPIIEAKYPEESERQEVVRTLVLEAKDLSVGDFRFAVEQLAGSVRDELRILRYDIAGYLSALRQRVLDPKTPLPETIAEAIEKLAEFEAKARALGG